MHALIPFKFWTFVQTEKKKKKFEGLISNKKPENTINKAIPFIITLKRIKYLVINLLKEMQDLYTEKYAILLKKIKDLKVGYPMFMECSS